MRDGVPIIGIVAGVVLLLVAIFSVMSFEEVKTGHRGVVTSFGAVEEDVMEEGVSGKWFWKNVTEINVQIQETSHPAAASSKDLQIVMTTVSINYNADPDYAWWIYQNIGESANSWKMKKLDPIIAESVKSVTAQYTAAELIKLREEVKNLIEEKIKNRADNEAHIIVTSVNITDFDFSDTFNESIEAKVRAEQDAQRAKNELLREKVEQEKKIVKAEADKQEQILIAEGKAQKIKLESTAQAEANRVLSDSIDDNILRFKKLEKWDGKLPKVTGGGESAILINPDKE